MTAQQKRRGRRPRGEFAKLTSPFSLRMPENLRKQLKAAADKNGRSEGQEVLARLKTTFARDPALHSLSFLISEVAFCFQYVPEWASDPFLFRAFRLGVAKLLADLDPSEEQKPSLAPVLKAYRESLKKFAATANKGGPLKFFPGGPSQKKWIDEQVNDLAKRWTTPEIAGNEAAASVLGYFHRGLPRGLREVWDQLAAEKAEGGLEGDWVAKGIVATSARVHYGMTDARRVLPKRRVKGSLNPTRT